MFFDTFKQLCDTKGISCNKAALEIGLSNATPTKWKKTGATPSSDTLQRIADYFQVPITDLLGITSSLDGMLYKTAIDNKLFAAAHLIEDKSQEKPADLMTVGHSVTDAKDSVILQGSNNNAVSNGSTPAANDGLDDMELELIRIYRLLDVRTKNKLMSYAFQLEDSIVNSAHTRRLDDICAYAQARAGAKSKGITPDIDR